MLKTLKRIVQDVTAASQLTEALTILVERVRKAVNADAVSVYLIDNKQAEYVLISTDGLNKDAEFRVRVSLDSGLIGFIGRGASKGLSGCANYSTPQVIWCDYRSTIRTALFR